MKHGDAQAWRTGHAVQFYESDAFLVDAVAGFVAEGFRVGQPAIIIATGAHRRALTERLERMGVEVDSLIASKYLVLLDAAETLSAFMEGDRPNAELVEATVGNVFEKVMKDRPYVVVRAFGEMVDLLWGRGRAAAALELEQLWNDLARKYSFWMLCAYAHASLGRDGSKGVADVCSAHSSVLLAETPELGARLGLQ